MHNDPPLPLIPRLEALFGSRWQAALDHADVISRRRARALGAGEPSSAALVAMVELLERLPVAQWPPRWAGLGKSSDSCPTLAYFSDRLVNGRIRREDAVLLFDAYSPDQRSRVTNIAVAPIPHRPWRGLPRAHEWRRAWITWGDQWDCAIGGGTDSKWMQDPMQTPEGILAAMIEDGGLKESAVEDTLNDLADRIHKFSIPMVYKLVDQLRIEHANRVPGAWSTYWYSTLNGPDQ